MAALEGFGLTLNGDDVEVEVGLYDGVAVAGTVFDLSVLTPTDGVVTVVLDGTTLSLTEVAVAGTQVKIGSFTSSTNVASALSLDGRGDVVPASV